MRIFIYYLIPMYSGSRQAELLGNRYNVHTPNNIYQYYISNKNHSIVDDGQKYP